MNQSRQAPTGGQVQAIAKRIPAPLKRFSFALTAYMLMASTIAAGTAHVMQSEASPQPLLSRLTSPTGSAKYLVLMVLDGAPPQYLDVPSLPHLDGLMTNGTVFTKAFDGILEAETPAGHATISTGSRPSNDGILGFDWANDGNRVSVFAPDQMTTVEQILQQSHSSTIGSLYKAAHPSAKVVALSGHKYYAAAPLGGPQADAIMYFQGDPKGRYVPVAVPGHVPPASVLTDPSLIYPSTKLPDGEEDRLATNLALKTIQQMRPRVLLINYPEFDWPLGHVYGGPTDKSAVTTDMQSFDSDLGRIEDAYASAGILNQTLFVITADHGMMPISHLVPSAEINNAITQAGTTAPDIASSSGDYIWLADSSRSQAVAENIAAARDPNIQSVYYLNFSGAGPHYVSANTVQLSASVEAANQYLLAALLNGHEPNVVVFGQEGVSFVDPSNHWKADHGGNSWQSQHVPLVLSGPGIRAGVVSDSPAQLDDIAPTVLTDMGVIPTGMEGRALTQALVSASRAELRARTQEVSQVSVVTRSLAGQDFVRGKAQ